jgi:hypothetical protein
MQVFTPTCFASIDFAARKSVVIEPRTDVLQRQFDVSRLTETERTHLREQLFTELLVKSEVPTVETNAIEPELIDFASAIRIGQAPRVTGADGRDAVVVAEAVLDRVRQHQWDGANSRRIGPLASPVATPPLAPVADSWSAEDTVILRRKAG